MTYDSDPPRLRISGEPGDPFVQALEAARLDLPNDEQLSAIAAPWAPLRRATNVAGFLSLGRARIRAKSLQAAAIALAAAVGVGATVLLKNGFPFAQAPVAATPPPSEPARVSPAQTPPHAVQAAAEPVASAEEAPAAPPEHAESAKSRAPAASAHRGSSGGTSERPSQADLPASDVDGPEAETALLGRAHQALASNPSRALELTREHGREYPNGVLGQESDLMAIEALVALGRTTEARSAAGTFRARYPSSAHLRRINRLLGDPQGAAPPLQGQ
ncbi:MAG TPA: hypothetical protein VHU80_03980 [Polyangiaceae bacterium]|jgi:hypothetical protein|nr:hypothetical protein [Polyangiaceae bacterium]